MRWAHWLLLTFVAGLRWQKGKHVQHAPASLWQIPEPSALFLSAEGPLARWRRVTWPDCTWPSLHRCRHNLQVLRAYCLECLMHLLAAPGCTRQREEPGVGQLQWEALR
jgi:hypothetical protein